MRCPKCSKNKNLEVGSTCHNCRHTIIFNPKLDKLSDKTFRELITSLRGTGETFFTENQLYTHYLETGGVSCLARFILWVVAIISLIFLININYVKQTSLGTGLAIDLIIVALFAGSMTGLFNYTNKEKATRKEFGQFVNRWLKHYPIPNLITKPSLDQGQPTLFAENDLYDYGVEGIVIVDQDIYVDLFVQNNYISEWKSVIISQSGYPSYLVEKVQQIINDYPSVKIKYLHDSDSSMLHMKSKVRNFLKLPLTVEEIDLGLHADDSNRLDIFKQRSKEEQDIKLDFLPPTRLATTMGAAIIGGILIGEVLRIRQSNSGSGSDFG